MEKQPFRITIKYLVAVSFIYLCTACAWLYLGAVTDHRTSEKDYALRAEVGRLWGGPHAQVPPEVSLPAHTIRFPAPATCPEVEAANATAAKNRRAGKPVDEALKKVTCPEPAPLELEALAPEPASTDAHVQLALEHRRKGLLWYSTYAVRFDGTYTFTNPSDHPRPARLFVPFPAQGAIYDEFALRADGKEVPVEITSTERRTGGSHPGALARLTLAPHHRLTLRLAYRSRGLDRWQYTFGAETARARHFKLVVDTDFDRVDFPAASLSPNSKQAHGTGQRLTWAFGNLLADAAIAVDMPQRLNPGPLAAEISRFAPVSLFFFFFILLLVSVLHQVRLHPVHYGMLAAAFFAFHLLMAYLVDHLPLWLCFTLASTTSVALVVSYLRLAVGARFAFLWAGGAQLLYLVLFSLAFFLEGYTGLTITLFSILTLFAVMQLTGRIDWASKFAASRPPLPVPPHPPHAYPQAMSPTPPGTPDAAARGPEEQDLGPVFSRVS